MVYLPTKLVIFNHWISQLVMEIKNYSEELNHKEKISVKKHCQVEVQEKYFKTSFSKYQKIW